MTDHWGGWWIPLLVLLLVFGRPWWRAGGPWWWPGSCRRERDPAREELDRAIQARLELVDQLETRVAELENRLDFAERLLAERRVEAGDRAG